MNQPRVVLDTNILISSLWGGLPRRIVQLWQQGRLRILMSRPILEEYLEVLARFHPAEEDLDIFVALLGHPKMTEWVAPREHVRMVVADPADNRFLECAVTGDADCLVRGDRHLLKLKQFQGIPILSPRTFLHRWFP